MVIQGEEKMFKINYNNFLFEYFLSKVKCKDERKYKEDSYELCFIYVEIMIFV